MARVRHPKLFSQAFKIKASKLRDLGVHNPTLNMDTNLFIDPLLLPHSKHAEIREGAANAYLSYYGDIIKLLALCKNADDSDVCWRNARKRLKLGEVKGTCLGYGAQSVSGSALGVTLQTQVLQTALQVVAQGITDPSLFALLPILEEGIGPDRISDMTTNIILLDLCRFTEKILQEFPSIPTDLFNLRDSKFQLPVNPFLRKTTPVILVPADILQSLPMALNAEDIDDVCQKNDALRDRINDHIGQIWHDKMVETRTKAEKRILKEFLLEKKDRMEVVLEALKSYKPTSYDPLTDSEGLVRWLEIAEHIAEQEPFMIATSPERSLKRLEVVATQITSQFKRLIEDKGLWKELWHENRRRPEKSLQRLFFAVAESYCLANDLDISPEVDSGSGPVDFKFSDGYRARYLVELKFSDNPKLVAGYKSQLLTYRKAESTDSACYLVVEVNDIFEKRREISRLAAEQEKDGAKASRVIYVNGRTQQSASKR